MPRLVTIFGSGETSPTMTSVHQALLARVRRPGLDAVLLDTPFGFQPNADEISARIVAYFRERVGTDVRVASLRRGGQDGEPEFEEFLSRLNAARYLFAGPGSPSYALRHWRNRRIRGAMRQKLLTGGCLAFASAAAISLGAFALPVYEIYKVGDDPSWTNGLDLLGKIGIRAAVIPHYDNREGGTHDTRYCYMGETRLRVLESMLPDDVIILGVDEHTACLIDVDAGLVTVRGRGGLTVRHGGREGRWQRTSLALGELQQRHWTSAAGLPLAPAAPEELLVPASVAPEPEQLREQVAPLVNGMLSLRHEARREQRFQDADRLRSILELSGVEVQDTPSGTAWSINAAR